MKKLILYLICIPVLLLCSELKAQQDPLFAHYMFNKMIVNPAYAGSADHLVVTATSRHQWIGIDGAPQTQALSVHAPYGKQLSWGVSMLRDQAGPLNNFRFELNAAYRLKLNKVSDLSFGLMAGLGHAGANLVGLDGIDPSDVSFQQNLLVYRPVFGSGVYYSRPEGFVGLSVPDLLKTSYEGLSNQWVHERHYYLMGGYITDFNDDFRLRPTLMFRYVKNAPLSAELTASVIMYDKFWAGLLYRYGDALGALISVQINKALRVGYSYDYSVNMLRGYQGGSHEISVSYDLYRIPASYTSPRFF